MEAVIFQRLKAVHNLRADFQNNCAVFVKIGVRCQPCFRLRPLPVSQKFFPSGAFNDELRGSRKGGERLARTQAQ